MNYGKLRCLGSQNRLKTKYGIGYQLQLNCIPQKIEGELLLINCMLYHHHDNRGGSFHEYQITQCTAFGDLQW